MATEETLPWEDPQLMSRNIPPPEGYEDITFTSSFDGSKQRYVLVPPNGKLPTGPVDVLFTFHGHGADRWQFITETLWERRATRQIANERGMLLVAPDYRAKTSWMGPAAEADVMQIVSDLRKRFDIRRIFWSGASMGGTASLTLAAMHPEITAGVVAMNPMADLVSYENFQEAMIESYGGTKEEKYEEYKKRSAIYFPERFTMPISITVGGLDSVVPPYSAMVLASAIHALHPELIYLDYCQWRIHMTGFDDAIRAFREMFKRADGEYVHEVIKF